MSALSCGARKNKRDDKDQPGAWALCPQQRGTNVTSPRFPQGPPSCVGTRRGRGYVNKGSGWACPYNVPTLVPTPCAESCAATSNTNVNPQAVTPLGYANSKVPRKFLARHQLAAADRLGDGDASHIRRCGLEGYKRHIATAGLPRIGKDMGTPSPTQWHCAQSSEAQTPREASTRLQHCNARLHDPPSDGRVRRMMKQDHSFRADGKKQVLQQILRGLLSNL